MVNSAQTSLRLWEKQGEERDNSAQRPLLSLCENVGTMRRVSSILWEIPIDMRETSAQSLLPFSLVYVLFLTVSSPFGVFPSGGFPLFLPKIGPKEVRTIPGSIKLIKLAETRRKWRNPGKTGRGEEG